VRDEADGKPLQIGPTRQCRLHGSAIALGGKDAKVLVSTARKEIIVVDDEPNMLKAIERLLIVHGFDTAIFDSIDDFRNMPIFTRPLALSWILISVANPESI
jgi:hypothetical protein